MDLHNLEKSVCRRLGERVATQEERDLLLSPPSERVRQTPAQLRLRILDEVLRYLKTGDEQRLLHQRGFSILTWTVLRSSSLGADFIDILESEVREWLRGSLVDSEERSTTEERLAVVVTFFGSRGVAECA